MFAFLARGLNGFNPYFKSDLNAELIIMLTLLVDVVAITTVGLTFFKLDWSTRVVNDGALKEL